MHPDGCIHGVKTIPLFVLIAYQMMFAQITPALITGAFTNRVRFPAYLIFLVAWLVLVYFPMVHMVWGGGLLAQWGVLDFAGGIVVHCIAGFAALASVMFVGRRRIPEPPGPHSIPLVALGTGLLWFGWYGFNAGSELRVDAVTSLAFLNTDIAASFAAIVWLIMAWVFEKKPKFVGLLTGSIAGLAAVTPAAGYVSTPCAVVIGIAASVVCYFAVNLKNRLGWDDALDVWGVHGVGGVLGVICLGIFADKAMNESGRERVDTWGQQFFPEGMRGGGGAAVYAFLFTYVMLWIINKFTRVQVTVEEEELGLDEALHGEKAYV
jgi:Amt family ammonium transporter